VDIVSRDPDRFLCRKLYHLAVDRDLTTPFFAIEQLTVFVQIGLHMPAIVKAASEIVFTVKIFTLLFHLIT
jgi:hypothetical protein